VKIRNKIVTTFFLVVSVFIFIFIIFLSIQKQQANILRDSTIENQRKITESIIEVKRSMLESTVYDYTYWDDMYDFASNPEEAWAEENIDTMEESFNYKISWVYNHDRQLVYHFDAIHSDFDIGDIIPSEVFDILDSEKFLNFFTVGGERVLEISAATIHPTHDVDRKISHSGYFIAGRLWDDEFLAQLDSYTDTEVDIVEPDFRTTYTDIGTISTYYPITDWQDRTLRELRFTRRYDIFPYFRNLSLVITILILALLLTFGGIVFIIFNKWVGRPLAKISKSLADKNPKEIIELNKHENEFGEISKLIGEHFEQTKKLEHEIEERKQAEEKLKRSLVEKEILLREVHHRVKNNMQVIVSLMKLQSAKLDNPEIIGQFTQLHLRVRSMAMVHERLYKTKDFSDIDFKEYIHDLVDNLYKSYVVEAKNIEMEYDIEEMHLSLNKAIPCGLIINELVTNSFKHAFEDAKSGKISIALKKVDGLIKLEIHDSGKGIPSDFDMEKSDSLGLRLVDILSQQLGGKFSWSQNEVIRFLVEFPAD